MKNFQWPISDFESQPAIRNSHFAFRNLPPLSFAAKGSALIWSARTRPRFGTTRHVASSESGDTSPHSKFGHCPSKHLISRPRLFD
jgi:hypothetical protein